MHYDDQSHEAKGQHDQKYECTNNERPVGFNILALGNNTNAGEGLSSCTLHVCVLIWTCLVFLDNSNDRHFSGLLRILEHVDTSLRKDETESINDSGSLLNSVLEFQELSVVEVGVRVEYRVLHIDRVGFRCGVHCKKYGCTLVNAHHWVCDSRWSIC